MKYYSTRNKEVKVSFREAVLNGLAPDGGLYLPEYWPIFSPHELGHLMGKPLHVVAFRVLQSFTTRDIPSPELNKLLEEVLNFPLKLVEVEEGVFSLELFHGPTAAFKDFGARFLARCMAWFKQTENESTKVLVATSGDTGSAVANGFLGMPGIGVVVLFPKGQVSPLQEKQMTTLGGNITCLEVNGSFDDCQKLVKSAFNDADLRAQLSLSSANSINIARLLPQSIYYAWAWTALRRPFYCAVPSGNFGNLTAGIIARSMGFPIKKFVAATNINKVVPEYLENGIYSPRPSVATLSNAMDVGHPSNFERLQSLLTTNHHRMQSVMDGFYATDEETLETMQSVKSRTGYQCDPHGAIGYRGLKAFLPKEACGVFLETAHPAKFRDKLPEEMARETDIPERLQNCLNQKGTSIPMSNQYAEFRQWLKDHAEA